MDDNAEKFAEAKKYCDENKIQYAVNDNGELVIKGDVDLSGNTVIATHQLRKLPDFTGCIVEGDFDCSYNLLTSLQGAPKEVGGSFNCSNNQLYSLRDAPQKVGKDFNCSYNELQSLEHAPQEVGGSFYCQNNDLESPQYAPQKVGKDFNCSYNKLRSLEHAPKEVGGSFYCKNNYLRSLEHAPQEVGRSFNCSNNPKLPNLAGANFKNKILFFGCDAIVRFKWPAQLKPKNELQWAEYNEIYPPIPQPQVDAGGGEQQRGKPDLPQI